MNGNDIPHPSEIVWGDDQEAQNAADTEIVGTEEQLDAIDVVQELSLGELANLVINNDHRTLSAVNSLFLDPNLSEEDTRTLLVAINEMANSDKSDIVFGTPRTLDHVARIEKTKISKKTQKIYDQFAGDENSDYSKDNYSYVVLNFDEGTKFRSMLKVGAYFTGLMLALPEFFNTVATKVFAAEEFRGVEARYTDTRNAVAGLVIAGLGLAIKVKRKKI